MRLNALIKEIFKERFPPKRVLFRTDAGRVKGLSFGHFFRCLILAEQLKKSAKTESVFLMRDNREGIDYAKSRGCVVRTLSKASLRKDYNKKIMGWIMKLKPDYLVVDLPNENTNPYIEYAKRKQILTVSIDDTATRELRSDIILNSSILADKNEYKNCLPKTRFMLGLKYFIMAQPKKGKKIKKKKSNVSVVISFGGSDPISLTEKVVPALARFSWENVMFTVITGPGFKKSSLFKKRISDFCTDIQVVDKPKNLMKYFMESDLAICSGGRTLYELHKLEIPTLAIASNAHEAKVINRFYKEGLILAGFSSWHKKKVLPILKKYITEITKD